MADENTIKISQEQIDGVIVNSVTGPSVDSSDPRHVIIPVIPSVENVNNKANKDGSNTVGGVWQIDYIFSEVLPFNKSVLKAQPNNSIEYGSDSLKNHFFIVNDGQGLKVKVGGVIGQIWNSFNFNPNDFYTKTEVGDIAEIPNWGDELEQNTNF